MRGLLLFLAVVFAATAAQSTPLYPDGALALEARLLSKIGPHTRAWIVGEARLELNTGYFTREAQDEASLRYGAPPSNFRVLSFLILMEAARDADADVANAVDSRDPAAIEVEREKQIASGIDNQNQRSEISPGVNVAQQEQGPMLLTSKLKSEDPSTAGTTHPEDVPAPPPPPKPADMQKVMDRESDIEDTLAKAMPLLTPAVVGAVQPMN